MLNVEQITSRLAQMPDPMLQKYAAMNKNDPYIMALAVSESNRRKQMRQAAQGMQGQMPQPKVVDQAVQGMGASMPEDMGIARLPAGDMNFADGGIVAFADGGDVERYNGLEGSFTGANDVQSILMKSPLERTPEENALLEKAGYALQSRTLPQDSAINRINSALTNFGPNLRSKLTAGASNLSDEELAKLPSAGGVLNERILRTLGIAPSAVKPGAYYPESTIGGKGPSNKELEEQLGLTGPGPALTTDKTAPKADTTQRNLGAAPTAPAAPSTGGLETIFKRLQGPMEKELSAVNTQRKTFAKSLQDFAKQEEADFEAAEAKRGDVFKGREERLAKREGELGEMKGQNLGLALLQAGAAMMSTPGSLGMALGKGVDVGTKQYASGIDKLNAAQDRLMDARDRLEELRTNREDMTAKERRALKSSINRSVLEGEKLFLDGAEKDLGYRREDMKTLFSGLVTDMASQRSAAATTAAAARTPAEIQLIERIAAEKKIPFSQAYQEVASMKREPVSRAEALKNWTANQAAIMVQNPSIKTFEDYYALQTGAGGGTGGFKYLGVSQ